MGKKKKKKTKVAFFYFLIRKMLLRMRKAIKRILKKEGKEKEKWMAVLKQACKLQIATIQKKKKKLQISTLPPSNLNCALYSSRLFSFSLFSPTDGKRRLVLWVQTWDHLFKLEIKPAPNVLDASIEFLDMLYSWFAFCL